LFLISLGFIASFSPVALAEESAGSSAVEVQTMSPLGPPDGQTETPQDQREQARQLYLAGSGQADAGRWDQAADSYRQAFALYRAPSILYNVGYCQGRLGQLVEGWQTISEAIALSGQGSGSTLSEERLKVAKSERDLLRQRLASIVVEEAVELSVVGGRIFPVRGESATYVFKINAEEPAAAKGAEAAEENEWLSLPGGSRILSNPGTVRIRQRTGAQIVSSTLELSEGVQTILPAMSPESPDASQVGAEPPKSGRASPKEVPPPFRRHQKLEARPFRTAGIAGLALGGTSLLTALVSTGIAVGADGQLKEQCAPDGTCPEEVADKVAQYETAATIANVSLVIGIASSVVGAGALILDQKMKHARVAVTVGPGSLRLGLKF